MRKEKGPLTKHKFRELIYASEPDYIRDDEVDYLFDLLDYSGNKEIDKDDFLGEFD
jgi:Ca2+-binding EF-hand superfamily protein